MQTRKMFRVLCCSIIGSNADDYTKAIAQVGLGCHDLQSIGVTVARLVLNLNCYTGKDAGQMKRVLRRVARKVAQ